MAFQLRKNDSLHLENWYQDGEASKVELDILTELSKTPKSIRADKNAIFDLSISIIDTNKPKKTSLRNLRQGIRNIKLELGENSHKEEKVSNTLSKLRLEPLRHDNHMNYPSKLQQQRNEIVNSESVEFKVIPPRNQISNKMRYHFDERSQNVMPIRTSQRAFTEKPSSIFNFGLNQKDISRRAMQRISENPKPELSSKLISQGKPESELSNHTMDSLVNIVNCQPNSLKKNDQFVLFRTGKRSLSKERSKKSNLKIDIIDTEDVNSVVPDKSVFTPKESQESLFKRSNLILSPSPIEIVHESPTVSTPKNLSHHFRFYQEKYMSKAKQNTVDSNPSTDPPSPNIKKKGWLNSSKAQDIDSSHLNPNASRNLEDVNYYNAEHDSISPLKKMPTYSPAKHSILQQAALAQLTSNSLIFPQLSPTIRQRPSVFLIKKDRF